MREFARGRSEPMIRFGSFSGKMPQKRSFLNTGGMIMDRFELLRKVFKRYNITPSKAARLEYDFVIRVAESEFYLQKANA